MRTQKYTIQPAECVGAKILFDGERISVLGDTWFIDCVSVEHAMTTLARLGYIKREALRKSEWRDPQAMRRALGSAPYSGFTSRNLKVGVK